MYGIQNTKKKHEYIYQKVQQTTHKEFRNKFRSLFQHQWLLLVSFYSFHIFDVIKLLLLILI